MPDLEQQRSSNIPQQQPQQQLPVSDQQESQRQPDLPTLNDEDNRFQTFSTSINWKKVKTKRVQVVDVSKPQPKPQQKRYQALQLHQTP